VSGHQDLVRELVHLRRGWGLQRRDLATRIGPLVSRLCGIEESDSDRQIREKIRLWLQVMTADLPSELPRALLVAFALDRAHQHPKLTSRVESLASEQRWAPRTARRRIDHATRLVAQAALGQGTAGADGGFGTGAQPPALAAVLRLDAAPQDERDTRVVVMRVPVPADRFDLLIRFEAG
jgi:hypothetical protein